MFLLLSLSTLIFIGCSGGSMNNSYKKSGPTYRYKGEESYKITKIKIIREDDGSDVNVIVKGTKKDKNSKKKLKRILVIEKINDNECKISVREVEENQNGK